MLFCGNCGNTAKPGTSNMKAAQPSMIFTSFTTCDEESDSGTDDSFTIMADLLDIDKNFATDTVVSVSWYGQKL